MFKLQNSFLLILVCLLLGYLYLQPSGTGEYQRSPDERYQASASLLQRNRLTGSRVKYLKFSIDRDRSSIWQATYTPVSTDLLVDFGDRREQFITWNSSSSAVTFRLAKGRSLTIPVP